MALTLSQVRTALADQLRNNLARQVNVYAYKPSAPQFPCIALVAAADYVAYTQTFDAIAKVELVAEVHISSLAIDEQVAVDDFLSAGVDNTSSIVGAIVADPTLGGAVEMCLVGTAQGPTLNPADPDPLVARIPLTIYCLTED